MNDDPFKKTLFWSVTLLMFLFAAAYFFECYRAGKWKEAYYQELQTRQEHSH